MSGEQQPANWRTKPCFHFSRGSCSYGDACNFLHGERARSWLGNDDEDGEERGRNGGGGGGGGSSISGGGAGGGGGGGGVGSGNAAPRRGMPPPGSPTFRSKPCRHHARGVCQHGDECTFKHVGESGSAEAKAALADALAATSADASADDVAGGLSQTRPSSMPRGVCHRFALGSCTYGDRCKYSHSEASSAPRASPQSSTGICTRFAMGSCDYGDRCRYAHVVRGAPESSLSPLPPPPTWPTTATAKPAAGAVSSWAQTSTKPAAEAWPSAAWTPVPATPTSTPTTAPAAAVPDVVAAVEAAAAAAAAAGDASLSEALQRLVLKSNGAGGGGGVGGVAARGSTGSSNSWRTGSSPQRPSGMRNLHDRVSALCVDALNFTDQFCPGKWDLRSMPKAVNAFVRAAAASRIHLTVFIDVANVSHETIGKWRARREREVAEGTKNVHHGMSILLGDAFREAGVEVRYSLDADNDDTLAAYAQALGADVLSGDKDFFRYTGRSYRVFSEFAVLDGSGDDGSGTDGEPGTLAVYAHPLEATGGVFGSSSSGSPRSPPSPRAILSPPPACVAPEEKAPWLPALRASRRYVRGAPSPLVRALGRNPHVTARPLRRALYGLVLGQGVTVIEEFPEWNSAAGRTLWVTEAVAPWQLNAEAAQHEYWGGLLVGSPDAAFSALFPAESIANRHWNTVAMLPAEAQAGIDSPPPPAGVHVEAWRKHVLACRAVAIELCIAASGQSLLRSLIAAE